MISRLLLVLTFRLSIIGEFHLNSATSILNSVSRTEQYHGKFQFVGDRKGGLGLTKQTKNVTTAMDVADVNEHAPIFIMPAFNNATIEVPENVGIADYLVMTVKAIDEDSGKSGKISYYIRQNNRNVQKTNEFTINVDTGDLRTKIILDGEKRTNYTLVLVACDNGRPSPKETLQFLTVMLVDTDENKLEFPRNSSMYHFQVTENSRKDMFVGKVSVVNQKKGKAAPVYYHIIQGNDEGGFYVNKTNGRIYTNTSFDREQKDEYNMFIKASTDPDYYSQEEFGKSEADYDSSVAHVKVSILDVNDNLPHFEQAIYYAGVNAMASIGEFVVKVKASDPDLNINGSVNYHIAAAKLFKSGLERFPYFLSPSPFSVAEDGRITTANYMAEYNQERIVLEIAARERAPPGRQIRTVVHVWVYQPRQLIRVILSRTPEEVTEESNEIAFELSNITQSLMVVDDIRYHVDSSGQIRRDWCDIYLHVVDSPTQSIMSVPEVLKLMDSKYYHLKDYYTAIDIENVTPAFVAMQEDTFNIILAALVAMVIVLLIGCVTLIVLCCYHRPAIAPVGLRKKEALIKQEIIDDINDSSERPFWIEQKLKLCEDQELTMQVYCVPDGPETHLMERRSSEDQTPIPEYCTTFIKHPSTKGLVSRSSAVKHGQIYMCGTFLASDPIKVWRKMLKNERKKVNKTWPDQLHPSRKGWIDSGDYVNVSGEGRYDLLRNSEMEMYDESTDQILERTESINSLDPRRSRRASEVNVVGSADMLP